MTQTKRLELHKTLHQRLHEVTRTLASLELLEDAASLSALVDASIHRVVVMGRHSVGKSSLLNAMLGVELIPEDVLTSTRGLIALRYAERETIYRQRGEQLERVSADRFKREAAFTDETRGQDVDLEQRWVVELPSRALPPGVTLIDTPGFHEGESDAFLLQRALGEAEAVIFVLNATQLLSLDELEQASQLVARAIPLIFIINKVDQIKDSSPAGQAQLIDYAQRRLREACGAPVAVVTFSAHAAREGGEEASAQIAALWERLHEQLQLDAPGQALLGLERAVSLAVEELPAKLTAHLRHIEEQARQEQQRASRAQDSIRSLKAQQPKLQACFDEAIRSLQRTLRARLAETWAQIVAELPSASRGWYSAHDPILYARPFTEEIAALAQAHIEREVQRRLAPLLMEAISLKLEQTLADVSAMVTHELSALSPSGAVFNFDVIQGESLAEALREVFGKDMGDDAMGAATTAAITAAVSGIIGYIIADIILFYILGAITGFLNPILLAAAAITGGFLYLTMGADAVREWVRGRIVDSLGRELSAPQTVERLLGATDTAVREQLERFSAAYLNKIAAHLEQVSAEQQRAAEAGKAHAASQREATQRASALMSQINELEIALRAEATSFKERSKKR